MALEIDIDENAFLRNIRDTAYGHGEAEGIAEGEAKGIAEGKAVGKAEGMLKVLRELLRAKFGSLPRWAEDQLQKASPTQLERWSKKVLTARSVENLFGKGTS